MIYINTFEDYTFSDKFDKNKWVELSKEDRKELKKEIWELVEHAYKPLGGHVRISDPDSVVNDDQLSFWKAIDVDEDPYTDVVIFARKSNHGYKISGWGHDGGKEAKKELLNQLASLLRRPGFWVEVSGKPSEILSNKPGVNRLKNIEDVKKIFGNSEINWKGNGVYTRKLADGTITDEEMVLGNPKL